MYVADEGSAPMSATNASRPSFTTQGTVLLRDPSPSSAKTSNFPGERTRPTLALAFLIKCGSSPHAVRTHIVSSSYVVPVFCTSVRCVSRIRDESASGFPSRELAQTVAGTSPQSTVRAPARMRPPSAKRPHVNGVSIVIVPALPSTTSDFSSPTARSRPRSRRKRSPSSPPTSCAR